ncbi:MAG: transposase [Planctomycetota bacterium]|nr:transposase [Planctomycetota bacterium]MCW8138288.1 transposase [Planctomycetota bacterium]
MVRRSFDVSEAVLLYAEAPARVCEACGANLWIRWHVPRFVQRLDGVYQVVRQVKGCPAGCGNKRKYRPYEDVRFVLPRLTYGTDVVIEVGERQLRGGTSLRAIGRDLNERGVPVEQSHVGELFRSYLALTKLARGDDHALRKRLLEQGGVILSADGVQYDDTSPVLYLVWDVLSGQPLFGERKTFKGKDDLVPLFERVKALDVPVLGIVSDKEKGLFPAVLEVFPDVPYQVCQNHFLKNCAECMSGDLADLKASVSDRAEKVQRIASRLHKAGVNSEEWELGSPRCDEAPIEIVTDEEEEVEAPSPAEDTETESVGADPVLQAEPLTEAQVAAEFTAMAKHAARASGRAPLRPPDMVRDEGLERVRAAVQAAAAKRGAHTRPSTSSKRR